MKNKRFSSMKQLKLFPDDKEPEAAQSDWPKYPVSKLKTNKKRKKFTSKEEYYKSKEWEIKRVFALNRANYRCQKCWASHSLEVHHLTYKRLYNERPKDLKVLCKKCHKKADSQRAQISRHQNARDTYLTNKYGEDYDYWDGQEQEVDDWWESKGEDF